MKDLKNEGDITKSLSFYRRIFHHSQIGMATDDSSGQCIEANEAFGKLIGANRDKALSQNDYHIESWKKSALLDMAISAVKENMEKHHEESVTSTFGRHITIDYHFLPFAAGEQKYLLLIASDVTERKKADRTITESTFRDKNIETINPKDYSPFSIIN